MKSHVSPAIIMRVKEFGESDLLVSFFTADRGYLRGIAKGARKSRHRFVNCLESFALVSLEFDVKSNLCFLHSGKLIEAHAPIRSDYASLITASYLIELTESLCPPAVKEPDLFALLKESLEGLALKQNQNSLPLVFEIKAMYLGGYAMNVDKCCFCNRAYSGQGSAVFIPEKGGIACLKCRQATARTPLLNPPGIKMIRSLQVKFVPGQKQVEWDPGLIDELKPVLKLHREYRLEKKLKTTKYME